MAQGGQNRKKAVVIISDGNDTSSRVGVVEVKQVVRETEVLVYAVGIDGQGTADVPASDAADSAAAASPADSVSVSRRRTRRRRRIPIPGSGGGYPPSGGGGRGGTYSVGGDDRVNVMALREITDDSGGRTEIVRDFARSRSGGREHRR